MSTGQAPSGGGPDPRLPPRIQKCRRCRAQPNVIPETHDCVRCGYTKCEHLMKEVGSYGQCFACGKD